MQNFSERLRYRREELGLSRLDFAKKLGLTNPSQISRYESGKNIPGAQILIKIAEILKIDLHWLLTGQSSPNTVEVAKTLTRVISGYLMAMYVENSKLDFECKELLSKKIVPIEDLPVDKTLTREEFRDAERLQELQNELKAGQFLYEELTTLQKIIKQKYLPSP
jgi:transcriptional regulator with XRE-family HTH domain